MGTNGNGPFREEELVHRKVKVGNEWQTRIFPVVGGRLRILHENNDNLSIQTDIVKLDADFVVVRAAVESQRGKFNGTGTSSAQRDARLADSLVELAETRAIARALRFGGIGVEYTGAEEVSHVAAAEAEREQTLDKKTPAAFPEDNGNGKPEPRRVHNSASPVSAAEEQRSPVGAETKPANGGNGKATQAQCRALWALTKKARYTDGDVEDMLSPYNASTFQELSRENASQLIGYLQTEVAA